MKCAHHTPILLHDCNGRKCSDMPLIAVCIIICMYECLYDSASVSGFHLGGAGGTFDPPSHNLPAESPMSNGMWFIYTKGVTPPKSPIFNFCTGPCAIKVSK